MGGPGGIAADRVFLDGRIYTLDPERGWARALAVLGDEIVYVGDDAGATAFVGDETQVIELQGRLVLPGFIETHTHLSAAARMSRFADCRTPPNATIAEGTGLPVSPMPPMDLLQPSSFITTSAVYRKNSALN